MSEAAVCTCFSESNPICRNYQMRRCTNWCAAISDQPHAMNDECRYDGYARTLPNIGLIRKPTALLMFCVGEAQVMMSCVHIYAGRAEMVQRCYDAYRDGARMLADLSYIAGCVDACYMAVPGRSERSLYPAGHLCHLLDARIICQNCRHTSVLHQDRFRQLASRFSPRIPGHDVKIWFDRVSRTSDARKENWGDRGLMRTAAWADAVLLLRTIVTQCR